MKGYYRALRQAATAVLLFAFLAGVAFGGVAEDLAGGKSLQDVIDDSLAAGVTVDDLVTDLVAADQDGKEIICGMFSANADKYEVVEAALDNNMNRADVINWSYQCGASRQDIQQGFSMAGETLTPGLIFLLSSLYDEKAKEYNYNPPSPSK